MSSMQAGICVLGAGSMGSAILEGLVRSNAFAPSELAVAGRKPDRLAHMAATHGVRTFRAGTDAYEPFDAVILCCKPHDLATVGKQLQPALRGDTLVISTLAGVPLETLRGALAHGCVVRAIPNIAASLNASITPWIAAPDMPAEQLALARRVIGAIGEGIEADDEKYVELATPLSGAAPALVALFVESLIDSSVHIGIPRPMATALIVQSVIASMQLIKADPGTAADVRARVTSPGGLTAECIATLEQHGLRTAVLQAVLAGLRKTRALNPAGA